jgi:hypothetical protein
MWQEIAFEIVRRAPEPRVAFRRLLLMMMFAAAVLVTGFVAVLALPVPPQLLTGLPLPSRPAAGGCAAGWRPPTPIRLLPIAPTNPTTPPVAAAGPGPVGATTGEEREPTPARLSAARGNWLWPNFRPPLTARHAGHEKRPAIPGELWQRWAHRRGLMQISH